MIDKVDHILWKMNVVDCGGQALYKTYMNCTSIQFTSSTGTWTSTNISDNFYPMA